ncbi:MAG: hypothetical protein LC623_08550 [Halobacteriales archaeon]|nr:hypothetical protein [Halobacteriales archaeon]
MTDHPTPPPPRASRPRVRTGTLATLAVLCAAGLAAPAFLGLSSTGGGHASAAAPRSGRLLVPFADSPETIASEAVAQMQAIAQGSANEMQQAGAAAVAEYEAAGSSATQALAASQTEGVQKVASVNNPPSALQQPPPGDDLANVTPSPQASSVPGYSVQANDDHSGGFAVGPASFSVTPYQGSDSQVKARLALNLPVTGNQGIDAAALALVNVYVTLKGDAWSASNTTGDNDITATWDDSTFGTVTATGEGATWQAAPDEKGAGDAAAHAAGLLTKANATLSTVLSGVRANVALEANLTAMVEAEITATLEAQEQAEAAVDAEAQARVDATFAASAQAEAQAHAAAGHHLEVVQQAQLAASQKLHAEATQQVELVTAAAAQAQESLRQQAAAALEAGSQAATQIHAAAEAAVQAIAHAPGVNNTDAGARAQAILAAAAAAEAAAQAKANGTAKALLAQAASVGAQVDVKVKAILTLEANAAAALDAKAKVAAQATLRAEAYTVAKIRVNAQAQAQAHLRAAAAAKFKLESAAKAHIRVVVKAALGVSAATKVSFDGSKPLGEAVYQHTDTHTTNDISYVREVATDYKESHRLDNRTSFERWNNVANQLDLQKDAVLDTYLLIEEQVQKNVDLFLGTQHDLQALGQQYT